MFPLTSYVMLAILSKKSKLHTNASMNQIHATTTIPGPLSDGKGLLSKIQQTYLHKEYS